MENYFYHNIKYSYVFHNFIFVEFSEFSEFSENI